MKSIQWRIPLAFVLAPVLPWAVFAATMLFPDHGDAPDPGWSGLVHFVLAKALFDWEMASLLLGVPAYGLLRRRRAVTLGDCLVAGLMAALLVLVVGHVEFSWWLHAAGYPHTFDDQLTKFNGHLTLLGFAEAIRGGWLEFVKGVAVGACFWFIGLRRHGTGGVLATR